MTQGSQPPAGALAGVRVLDMSRVLAGPWCGQILADLGAEVIKVERPGCGDDTRGWGPPYLKDAQGNETHESAYYLSANRGKKSVTLDIATAAGQEIARRLAAQSDVLIENYKAGDLTRYNLGYEQLRPLNPGLVYCSITGFGQTGPMRNVAGYDFIIQAIGGLMSVTGQADERPGGEPLRVGVAVADLSTGMYATVAILAALFHRARTGEGQYIDMALLDTQVSMIANMNMNYLISGRAPRRIGNAHANIVPYQVFDAADGKVVLAVESGSGDSIVTRGLKTEQADQARLLIHKRTRAGRPVTPKSTDKPREAQRPNPSVNGPKPPDVSAPSADAVAAAAARLAILNRDRLNEADLLRKLADLHRAGVLTDIEFEEKIALVGRLVSGETLVIS